MAQQTSKSVAISRGRRRWGTVIAVAASAALLTSCSAPDIASYENIRARLDVDTATIRFPLDDYSLSGTDALRLEHANEILLSRCLAQRGFDDPRATLDVKDLVVAPDRRYGIWTTAQAETRGYALPTSPADDAITEQERAQPQAWWDASTQCIASTEQLPVVEPLAHTDEMRVVDDGIVRASDEAKADEHWKAARQKWVDCIAADDLTPQSSTSLVPTLPADDDEAQRKIALIDVRCKTSTGVVQTMADIEARYQQAYIDEHADELNSVRARVHEIQEKVNTIITEAGNG